MSIWCALQTLNQHSGIELTALPRQTPKLNAALTELVSAFAEMKKPSHQRFLYQPRFNRKGQLRPTDDKTITAFAILGDSQGASINSTNIAQTYPLIFSLEKDAVLWILPIFLRSLQEWWQLKTKEAEARNGDDIENEIWKMASVRELRFLMYGISGIFCDVYKGERGSELDPDGCALKIRLENAEKYKQHMTEGMRLTLKAYLVTWYGVFGRKMYFAKLDMTLGKQYVHNCWL